MSMTSLLCKSGGVTICGVFLRNTTNLRRYDELVSKQVKEWGMMVKIVAALKFVSVSFIFKCTFATVVLSIL